jgi:hypothetical protein
MGIIGWIARFLEVSPTCAVQGFAAAKEPPA